MRRLAQPEVLKSAGIGALLTTLLSYPRLSLWSVRSYPVWYLEAVVFCGSFVLWAFVFAWHTQYSQRPVCTFEIDTSWFTLATLAGLFMGTFLYQVLDPSLRVTTPGDYPANFEQWSAMVLFSLMFNQLFLVFAPFAWLLRLFRRKSVAFVVTVLFGVFVLAIKTRSSPQPIPAVLFAALLGVRLVIGVLSLLFYLRGGVILVWWWGFLIQARHLLSLENGP